MGDSEQMTNNFRAVKQQLLELESEVNAVPVKTQGAKQALYMILKNIENIEFHIDRAEKHELIQ
jgi:hypothetical protein